MVQGVGFRPYVQRMATARGLRGVVRNGVAGLLIDVEGDHSSLDDFVRMVTLSPPPLARIERVECELAPPGGHAAFAIDPSESTPALTPNGGSRRVMPDVATCDACLRELFDPADRRFRYPFITCTECGPRLTVMCDIPYDRARTTMAVFPLCRACRDEYESPASRRFHAQAIACSDCGPQLALYRSGSAGQPIARRDAALGAAVDAIRAGRLVAVKGIGGYHIACLARPTVVAELRGRKRRPSKPFAIMAPDLEASRVFGIVGRDDERLLRAPERPIVLLRKREHSALEPMLEAVAPRNAHIGVMLPYSPLHHLLLAEIGEPLVMTSGNVSDEPIVCDDADAFARLGGLVDYVLTHDRAITLACDDSVARAIPAPQVIRRSRGYAPTPIPLSSRQSNRAHPGATVIAVGGQLKNTFCLVAGEHAFVSPHLGDVERMRAYESLRRGIAHFEHLFGAHATIVAHDLHPDYPSTRLAAELARDQMVGVQHHHAHIASCLAEHGITEPAIGVAFDGAGLGDDGTVWGGEVLIVDGARFERAAHLLQVPQPGGDAAVREPWRMALAHLRVSCGDDAAPTSLAAIPTSKRMIVERMLATRAHTPLTSSAGRLFDAVASLAGVCNLAGYEGEAAVALEWLAEPDGSRTYTIELDTSCRPWAMDTRPLIREVVEDVCRGRGPGEIAGAFHRALARGVTDVCARLRDDTGIGVVALSGGVFQNALLTRLTVDGLERRGLRVLTHRRVPCNDGGLSLGQAWIAREHAAGGPCPCA